MMRATSQQFHVSAGSWLGRRLDSRQQEVYPVRDALRFECRPNKGETPRPDLQSALRKEETCISELSEGGVALRGDCVEKARAHGFGGELCPSVDVMMAGADCLLLVECKYRANPETRIVKSIDSFQSAVACKFDKAISFLQDQGVRCISKDRVVLFNADSIDKALNMFKRLQLEDESQELECYRLMDTVGFGATYQDEFLNS